MTNIILMLLAIVNLLQQLEIRQIRKQLQISRQNEEILKDAINDILKNN